MQQGIVLNVFEFTRDQLLLLEEGIEVEYEHVPIRIRKFYNIDSIGPEDEGHCIVTSGGIEYICVESYSEVDTMISAIFLFLN